MDKNKKEEDPELVEEAEKEKKPPAPEFSDTLNEFYQGGFLQDKFDGEGTY